MLKQVLLAGGMAIAAPALFAAVPAAAQVATGRTPLAASAPTTQTATPQTAPAPQQPQASAPTGDAIAAQTAPATPTPAAPADPVVTEPSATPTAPAGTPAPAAPAQAAPAPGEATPAPSAATPTPGAKAVAAASPVATIVDREYPAYDKDSNGALSAEEFNAWMVALRKASDPATDATSPATQQWLTAAFTQADADKNRGVTKAELIAFLSQGQS